MRSKPCKQTTFFRLADLPTPCFPILRYPQSEKSARGLSMKSVHIDRSKRLKQEAHTGHNRWHPDIPPILEVEPGEDVVLETRDARDGQIRLETTVADLEHQDKKSGHPLTGPIFVRGAEPGDLLEIEYLDIIPQPYGWTR